MFYVLWLLAADKTLSEYDEDDTSHSLDAADPGFYNGGGEFERKDAWILQKGSQVVRGQWAPGAEANC